VATLTYEGSLLPGCQDVEPLECGVQGIDPLGANVQLLELVSAEH
jgi:hypothetical protein